MVYSAETVLPAKKKSSMKWETKRQAGYAGTKNPLQGTIIKKWELMHFSQEIGFFEVFFKTQKSKDMENFERIGKVPIKFSEQYEKELINWQL